MQSVQRHFGKYMKRSADEKQISVLLKDFEEADHLLTKIIESSKAWKEAWIAILTHQARILTELESLYQPILGAGADYHGHQALETDAETLARTTRYKVESEELKRDLAEDLAGVDSRMIHVAQSAKDSLQMMKKPIRKREDKKLDYERYQSRVDSGSKKAKPSDRDRATLTKAESELAAATDAYNNADEHLRQVLPPILAAVFSLLPHILAAQIDIQNALLGHYYTSIHTYCTQEGFPNPAPPMDEVVRLWSDSFLPVQKEVESLTMIASGKAVRLSMNQERSNSNGYLHNGHRRPSAHSTLSARNPSPSPARALPPSPQYDIKPKISTSPSPSASFLLSPTEQQPPSASPAAGSHYQTPVSAFSPAGPNTDYFSRDRQASSSTNHQLATPSSMSSLASSVSTSTLPLGKKKPPPPPPRMNSQTNWIFVTALYDFGGQGEGDLVFKEGDRIRVIKQTESKDDWWQGELRGMKGAFPANYCE